MQGLIRKKLSTIDEDLWGVPEDPGAIAQELIEGASALGGNMGKRPEPGSPLDAVMQGQGV